MTNNDWEAGAGGNNDPPSVSSRGRAVWFWSALAVLACGLFIYLMSFPPGARTSNNANPNGAGAVDNQGARHPAVGTELSALVLEPLTGEAKPIRLDDLQGKVVLVNYWGTWCGPCRLEFPQLVALQKNLRKEADFRLLSVSCGPDADIEERGDLETATRAFLREAQVNLPTYHDRHAASRRALVQSARLEGFAYPTTVLLDRQGKIRALWSGYHEAFEREMQVAVREALAEK